MRIIDCEYFVVGSGMSGLMSALHLASAGRTVLVTKQRLEDCNTNFAQGGICCVADPADSFEEHVRDTQIAGAGLCDESVVRRIVSTLRHSGYLGRGKYDAVTKDASLRERLYA